jgi:phospholipid-binding lipoprotein MlaA
VALLAASPQSAPTVAESLAAAVAPAEPLAAARLATDPTDIQGDDEKGSSAGAEPATSAPDTVPELADPMIDPAAQPSAGVAKATHHHFPGDGLEGFNRTMFGIQMNLDKSIYRPLAMGYEHVVPKPVRLGLRNFFSNLSEPVVFLNDLLQLKLLSAAQTLARFAINSTVGLAGLLDVGASKHVNLPHHDNSFGNTLAYYGVHAGSYLFLPLVGPTTLRDFASGPVDGAVLPIAVGKPFTEWRYMIVSSVITGLDLRAQADPELRALFAGALDPYATLRSVWLQNRAAEISALHHHGKAVRPVPELEDPMSDPAGHLTPAIGPSVRPLAASTIPTQSQAEPN